MKKKDIAKMQVIAGVVLIVLAVLLNIIVFKVFMNTFVYHTQGYGALGYELSKANQTSIGTATLLNANTASHWLASFYGSFSVALLLDLVILAQAVMFISMGLKTLAKE